MGYNDGRGDYNNGGNWNQNNNRGGWNDGGRGGFSRKPEVPLSMTDTRDGLAVSAPYSVDFVNAAKDLRGRWQKETKTWLFDPRIRADVDDLLSRIFGDKWSSQSSGSHAEPENMRRESPRYTPVASRKSSSAPVTTRNGVAPQELPEAFRDDTPPENVHESPPEASNPPVTSATPESMATPRQAALVKGKLLRLGEELSNLDFEAMTSEELFAFSERLATAGRVLAFEAGRHTPKTPVKTSTPSPRPAFNKN